MPCSNIKNPHFIGNFGKKGPFQIVIAQCARHRSMPHHIFTHKIFDDLFAEYLTGIIRDMTDSQTLCQMAGIFQIFGRVVQLIETESNSGHLISGFQQSHGSYGTVRTTAHS